MQDLNDKITGNVLTAAEWNEVPSEIQNVIEGLGQVLSSGDLNQLGKGIAGYVANGTFYTDSGVADAYVLSVIGLKQVPTAYTDGFKVRFLAGNANTGASTINVASLGVKNLKMVGGVTPPVDIIRAGATIEAVFNGTDFILDIPFPELVVSKTDSSSFSDPILRVLVGLDPEVRMFADSNAQNMFFSTGGSALNNGASGSKDGANNAAFGFGNFTVATTTHSSAAFAFNSCRLITTGDSVTGLGYQTISRGTTCKNILAAGTDAGFNITTALNIVALGRHTLFDGTGATDFIGSNSVFLGTDIGLLATDINDSNYIGNNCGRNALTSTSVNVMGAAALRDCPSPSQSTVIGGTAHQTTLTLLEVVTIGDRAVQNSLSDTQSVNLGADCFFTAVASNQTNLSNVGVGFQTAFNVWGARNTLLGNRAGARASLTELNDAVLIGHRAGDGTAVDDDLIISNSTATANELIKGNFSTKVMRIEATALTFRNLPSAAGAAGTLFEDASGFVKVSP